MATVNLTDDGQSDFDGLPVAVANRVLKVLERLEQWPAVSGAKPLRGDMEGNFRMRTGDDRVVFGVAETKVEDVSEYTVNVWKIGYRGSVYE